MKKMYKLLALQNDKNQCQSKTDKPRYDCDQLANDDFDNIILICETDLLSRFGPKMQHQIC